MRSLLLATAIAVAAAPLAMAATETFTATLSPDAEVPPHQTQGTGGAKVTLDTDTHVITYTITYSDLTGPATAAHLHGPAKAGKNADVLIPIAGPLASPIKGMATLTPGQQKDLGEGEIYVNVHTATNKGGELRGQLEKTQ